jgi:hypothetical protein
MTTWTSDELGAFRSEQGRHSAPYPGASTGDHSDLTP